MGNKFYKVSYDAFISSFEGYNFDEEEIRAMYANIKLPRRATKKSAGYDFFTPFGFELAPNKDILIPTGVKANIKDSDFLAIFPRSGHGFKFYTRLANTVGIVDADYFFADNDGHIFIKIRNESDKLFRVAKGQAIAQGIFIKYGITDDDDADGEKLASVVRITHNYQQTDQLY